MNPYYNQNFWGFLEELANMPFREGALASDEIQLFSLLFVAASTILVGFFLIFEKMTMVAHSISHTILLGIVLGILLFPALGARGELSLFGLFLSAMISAIATLGLMEWCQARLGMQKDLANGYIFTTLFALGIFLVNLFTKSSHIGLESVLGDIDMVGVEDLFLSCIVFCFDGVVIALFFKELKLYAFDPAYAKITLFRPFLCRSILTLLTALTAVSAFRIAGVIMPLAFMTAPIVAAQLFCRSFLAILLWAEAIGIAVCLISVALSRHLLSEEGMALSTSGLAVTLLFVLFLLHLFLFMCKKKMERIRLGGNFKL